MRSHSSQWQGMPESSLHGLRGECGFLPSREAPGLFPVGALTGSLCFRYGSYMIWKELGGFSKEAVVPLGLYAGQLALNWAWPPLFFGARQMGWVSVALACLPGPWRWAPRGGTWVPYPSPPGLGSKGGGQGRHMAPGSFRSSWWRVLTWWSSGKTALPMQEAPGSIPGQGT